MTALPRYARAIMPRTRRSFALAAASIVVALVACGGGDDPTGTDADVFIREYCGLTAKCCDPGHGDDPGECADSFSAFNAFFPRPYDAAKANGCLAKLRATTTCEFSDAEEACAGVFGDSSPSGKTPPGGACQTKSDCAPSSEGQSVCTYLSGGSSAICQLSVSGGEGAMCDGTKGDNYTSWVDASTPTGSRVVVCERASDLVCDGKTRSCKRLRDPGEACDTTSDCKSELCLGSKCLARAEIGESCASTSCIEAAYCSPAAAGTTCVEKRAAGVPCTSFTECKSGNCMAGTCKSYSTSPPLGCFSSGK